MNIDQGLLDIIVCPNCHGELAVTPVAGDGGAGAGEVELVCQGECGYAYPVRDEIPVLLVDEARKP
ncbi:Trm112 family protein [Nocardioides marmotae]|uniref:Trm112 family protein n=1 Tax=Nocardioides marmotae TaxID=2663857 RepID=A0A6I3J8S4_9ACTN|nr:Trm112 family protein [Nocardioides marmotae]MCR6031440.1 Trm112 family protein [Gordonia jinghuaiqii]MBC9735426.1 Trm112 family protein [Nocardioides marmotae]MTB86523.1 Trm112 family protein [Nocardioides marmotae]MTB95079.1 Trm112 family protein [Nocardioides marmotae]QKE02426.1 Trm112 family protein [Nocardioides marmotae]